MGFFVSTCSVVVARCYKKNDFFHAASRTRRLEKYCLFCYTSRQIRLSWNKKICEISRKFTIGFFAPTYSVFVVKCNKTNNIFPNGVCATPLGKKLFFVTSCDNYTVSWNKKANKISDLFCKRFLFQLRVYFCVYKYRKFPIYIGIFRLISSAFFVST